MLSMRKIRIISSAIVFTVTLVAVSFLPTVPAFACKQNEVFNSSTGKCENPGNCTADQIYTSIAINGDSHCIDNPQNNTDLQTNPIYTVLLIGIQFLSAGVGIAVVGGIVWGGIMYLTSRENAGQTQKAISIIINSLIALLLYIFMFAILNFLIPGGIFS